MSHCLIVAIRPYQTFLRRQASRDHVWAGGRGIGYTWLKSALTVGELRSTGICPMTPVSLSLQPLLLRRYSIVFWPPGESERSRKKAEIHIFLIWFTRRRGAAQSGEGHAALIGAGLVYGEIEGLAVCVIPAALAAPGRRLRLKGISFAMPYSALVCIGIYIYIYIYSWHYWRRIQMSMGIIAWSSC